MSTFTERKLKEAYCFRVDMVLEQYLRQVGEDGFYRYKDNDGVEFALSKSDLIKMFDKWKKDLMSGNLDRND